MVSLQAPPKASGMVTRLLNPRELIPTGKGSLTASAWLQRERDRLAQSGIACEIIQVPSGRIGLRKRTKAD